ncbi:MAG: heavy metal resistance protein CzcA [Alphaproteobacteria bacterium]|nr:heavy metal resistance protein CzcA [Alphaproteobacteria bacterium]
MLMSGKQDEHDKNGQAVANTVHNRGLVTWFQGNHAAANILMLFFLIAGLASLTQMVRETFPTIDPKIISVTVPYPGATPSDVESGITRRVEEAVIGVQGVKRVESNAQEGIGIITIEIEDFVNGEEVLNDVETEIDSLQDFPPENAEEVNIVRVKPRSSVLTLVVYGDAERVSLREWAETIEDQLIGLPNISLVELAGTRDREISIEISETKLRQYNLNLGQIADIIGQHSIDLPAGTLQTESGDFLIRVQERRYYGSNFRDVVIRSNPDGSLLRLGEIASINDGFEDVELINTYNGKPAIFLDITRSSSQDTIDMEKDITRYVEDIELPENINLAVWKNQTDVLVDRINLLLRNAIMGFALVFIALLLFLDLKLAFWVAFAIPISFLGGLFFASLMGVSINMISLFALIVVLGIVVDDAIVTGESIFTEQDRKDRPANPALVGVKGIQAPVTIGVLTTVAAFAPLIFSTGTLGQILRPIPLIVISVLLVSLFEAFFILPAHLSSPKRWSRGYLYKIREAVNRNLERFIEKMVLPVAKVCIAGRYIFLFIVGFICFIAFYWMISGSMKFVFFPQIESDEITVNLEMPEGTPFEITEKYTAQIVDTFTSLNKNKWAEYSDGNIYESIAVSIGLQGANRGGPADSQRSSFSSNLSQVQIELVPSAKRSLTSKEVSRQWRAEIGEIPQAKKIAFESSLVSAGADITIELSHRDGDILDKASEELKQSMSKMTGLSEVSDSLEPGKKEFIFELTPAGLAAGLTPFDVGRQLRDSLRGRVIDRVQRGTSEVEIVVRYPKSDRRSLSAIEEFRLTLPNGEQAPINVMTDIKEAYNASVIKRVNGRQVVSVTADTDNTIITADEAITQIRENQYAQLQNLYPGLTLQLGGQNEDQRNDLATLGKNMLIALLAIFVMLTSQLRSYSKPFIIMLIVPLGIAGAIYGHALMGFNLSFISLFGMVALTGVVINDSVVLVDYYNNLQKDNPDISVYDAALQSLQRRFRPILLTTLTTSLGLLPILLETSLQAQFIIPMAVSLAFGLIFASSFLIFFLPALLVVFEDMNRVSQKITSRKKAN